MVASPPTNGRGGDGCTVLRGRRAQHCLHVRLQVGNEDADAREPGDEDVSSGAEHGGHCGSGLSLAERRRQDEHEA